MTRAKNINKFIDFQSALKFLWSKLSRGLIYLWNIIILQPI